MSIRKITDTTWEHEFPGDGYRNEEHEIEITAEGIVIHYDLLTWEEIDAARQIISANAEPSHR